MKRFPFVRCAVATRALTATRVAVLAILCLSSCTVDGFGFFGSASAPDDRFAESRSMAQPADISPLQDDLSFIFVSDLHIDDGTHAYFRGLKDRLNGASFIVVGGDISQMGKKTDIDGFIAEAASIGVPVYATIGNHDLYSCGWSNSRVLGPSSFTVKIGNSARLICIDTGNGTIGRAQAEWLENLLASSSESTVIIATHMQFFKTDYFETQQLSFLEETAMLLSMYRKYGVDLTLSGHSHKYDDRVIGSTKHPVSPSFLDHSNDAGYLFVSRSGGVVTVERKYY